MDQQIVSLFSDGKFSELEQVLKSTQSKDLLALIDRRVVRGTGDPAVLVRAVFTGSPASRDEGVKRRLLVLKHAIDLFQADEIEPKVAAELIGILLNEMDSFPAACLVDLANHYVDGIKNSIITTTKCLELFPKILSALETKEVVAVNGSEIKGTEYKSHILNSLCSSKWESSAVLHLVAMLRDISLSVDELGHVIAKTIRQFHDIDQQELPPLIYQLLLLSTKGHKKMVLVGVITYFVEEDAKHSENFDDQPNDNGNGLACVDGVTADQLHHVEGTVILHITFAVKQDQQLGREFVKYFKSYQLFSMTKVLSPFNVALALSLGRIHSFEEQVFELLKSAIIKSYRDAERRRQSSWIRNTAPDGSDAAEQILQTIKNSIVGWDHITQGLVQLGFALMESFGPRPSASKLSSAIASSTAASKILNPSQAACQLGVRILRDAFRVHDVARAEIIERLLNCIVTRAAAPVTHYLELLSSTVKASPHSVLECLPRLREAFDYLMFLPLSAAEGFLSAINPLLRLSAALRDSLVLVLRKAVFSRLIESRRIAVTGFLMLLNNYHTLGGNIPSSQSASQSSYASSSQVQVDIHVSRNVPPSEALCLEIINTMKRCLTQQADVRLILYEGLYDVLKLNPQLTDSVIELLTDQLRMYFEGQLDVNPPLRLDGCIAMQGDQPYVAEPLTHLLSSLTHCILLKKEMLGAEDQMDDNQVEEDNKIISSAEELLESLVQRMIKCEPEDFELDKSADFSPGTSVGVRNTILALLVSGLYEVLIEFEFQSANYNATRCQQVVKLFQNYQRMSEVLRTKPAVSNTGGSKKRGRQPKDAASVDTSSGSKTTTSGLLSIGFLSAALTAIYSDNIPSHHEGIVVLSANLDLQRHLVLSAVIRLQQICHHGRCDSIAGHSMDHLIKCCTAIGQTLLKQYSASISSIVSSSNGAGHKAQSDSAKNRAFVSSCLDGFAQVITIFCSRYSHRLSHFLYALEKRRASDKSMPDEGSEQALIYKLIQRLQRMAVSVLTSVGDERPIHDAAVLVGVIGQLSQLLNAGSSSLTDVENWLLQLVKEQNVDEQAVVKVLLQQLLCVTRQSSSAVEVCRDIARDVHICLGDIDQDSEVDARSKMFGVVGVRVAPCVVHILTSHLEVEIDDAEWIISRMKAESAELMDISTDSTQSESIEKSVCTRLGHVINACHELLQSALPIGPCVDALMRIVCRLYIVLTLLVKWSLSLYSRKIGRMSSRFEKLVKLSGTNLTQSVYPMITYVQMSQSEQLQTDVDKVKKGKKSRGKSSAHSFDKARILKETRSIPNLIYSIEQYEKYLIQLSKKSKVDLMAHFKMSTSRDFRINVASLQAAIERAATTQSDDSDGDQADVDQDNNHVSVANEEPAPASKRPRVIETSQLKKKMAKGKLSKK